MNYPRISRAVLRAILHATYTPFELREFVQLCHDLALPHIRKKIVQGKINLNVIGLREQDVVYDCLADLFQRDEGGSFSQIRKFFENEAQDIETEPEDKLLIALQRIVIGKVNNNIIRLYSEADPALGKILRNLKLAVDRTIFFEEITRFNERVLIPRNTDPLFDRPPFDTALLKQTFLMTVLVHDNIPSMVEKLHNLLCVQEEFQRAVSVVSAGLLFKEVYSLGWNEGKQETDGTIIGPEEIRSTASNVVEGIRKDLLEKYVEAGKCTRETFVSYLGALQDILDIEKGDDVSYFEYLRHRIPGLTRDVYLRNHRAILEYLAKLAKDRMRKQLEE